jgi:hypothetical protein
MQAPIEPAPVEISTLPARMSRYRWITTLYAVLAGLSGLLAHALAPALIVAFWQKSGASSPGVLAAWTLFIASFLLAILLAVWCGYLAARAASERTGRRGSGLGVAAIVATAGIITLAVGGVVAVLAQASPLTAVSSPPLGVAALSYHEGMAQGLALFYCAAYLPLLLLTSAAGILGATRGAKTALRARAGAPTIALPQSARRVA